MQQISIPEINQARPFASLSEYIHNETDNCSWYGRLWKAVKSPWQEDGCLAGITTTTAVVIAKVYTFTFTYFCLEGSYRALEETFFVAEEEGRVASEVGDAGGWSALAIFSVIALGTTLSQYIRENEFRRVKPLCKTWYNSASTGNVNIEKKKFYSKVNGILETISSEGLYNDVRKNTIGRTLIALQTMNELESEEKDMEEQPIIASELSLDRQLQPIYQAIHDEQQTTLSLSNYSERMLTSWHSIKETTNKPGQAVLIITGIACPIILLLGSIGSIVGDLMLGYEVLIQHENLLATGHVGEWPFNAVESSCVAAFLHSWCLLREGDFLLTQKIFLKHMEQLDTTKNPLTGNKDLYNRLCDVANQEMTRVASACYLSKLPLDYEFEMI